MRGPAPPRSARGRAARKQTVVWHSVYSPASMSQAAVQVAVADGVATVTVDHPPVNALADPVLEGLADAARDVREDPAVRAVVLTGAGGRTFLAWADLQEFERMLGDRAAMEAHV